MTQTRHRLRRVWLAAIAATAAVCLGVLPTGCNRQNAQQQGGPVKVAYLGLTCEAPIFVAHEQGFFKEEGLEVEMIRTDWDGLREGLATGNFHANHTLVMYVLQGIENNADMKITAGVHTGCLRVQVPIGSSIKTAADLKGKKIGVTTNLRSPPFMFASRVLAAQGIDPRVEAKQVTWLPYPPGELELAMKNKAVDAIATSDPIGTILLDKGVVRTIADQAVDPPYKDEYCCCVVVNGQFAKNRPADAAKVTRAILKAAKWVEVNPKAAAEMAVAKTYISASPQANTHALAQLRYIPAIARCNQSVHQAAADMGKAGLLKPGTNPEALANRAWLDLDGVTDEWIGSVKVAAVPGGGPPAPLPRGGFAALFAEHKLCCACCCVQ